MSWSTSPRFTRRFTRWIAVAVVLTLTLGVAGAAPAASSRPAHAAPASESLLALVRDWVSSVFGRPAPPPAPPAGSPGIPAKAGCGMDPDGKPLCK